MTAHPRVLSQRPALTRSTSTTSPSPIRYRSRYPSTGFTQSSNSRACPVCGGTPRSSRSVYCEKAACKQRAYRLRHQPLATVDLGQLRRDLQRRRTLVAHTIYECSTCGERALGERRCPECGLFGRAVGLGGACPGCDETILLIELLELE